MMAGQQIKNSVNRSALISTRYINCVLISVLVFAQPQRMIAQTAPALSVTPDGAPTTTPTPTPIDEPAFFLEQCIKECQTETSDPTFAHDFPDPIAQASEVEILANVSENLVHPGQRNVPLDLSNKGLLVADPLVNSTNSRQLADFGSGCSAWLNLVVGGQVQLGRSAPWSDISRVIKELGRKDLRLTPAEAVVPARKTGVNFVATGTIRGSSPAYVLDYRIYSVPSDFPIGQKIEVHGSLVDIIDALPTIAAKFDQDLGISNAAIPPAPMSSSDDMSLFGSLYDNYQGVDQHLQLLAKLTTSNPVAGALFLESSDLWQDQILLDQVVDTLLDGAPNNAIVIQEISEKCPNELRRIFTQTSQPITQYPKNGLLALAEYHEECAWGSETDIASAISRAATDSPDSPADWDTLSSFMLDAADDLRNGRGTDLIGDNEWPILVALYASAESDSQQAVRLDPSYGHAWWNLSVAALFNGDDKVAEASFDKAEDLDENKVEVYRRGLEMYQPKWEGELTKLDTLANVAVHHNYDNIDQVIAVANELHDVTSIEGDPKYAAMGSALIAQTTAKYNHDLQVDPNGITANLAIGKIMIGLDGAEISPVLANRFKYPITVYPNSALLHEEYGTALRLTGDLSGSETELERATALDPDSANAHYELGYARYMSGTIDAIGELRMAECLNQNRGMVHDFLGDLYQQSINFPLAVAEFDELAQDYPQWAYSWQLLCQALDLNGSYKETITAGQEALYVNSTARNGSDQQLANYVQALIADATSHLSPGTSAPVK